MPPQHLVPDAQHMMRVVGAVALHLMVVNAGGMFFGQNDLLFISVNAEGVTNKQNAVRVLIAVYYQSRFI